MLKSDESKDLNQKTWASWATLHSITANCMAVQSTSFISPDPQPTWFKGLNDSLIEAKAVATDWVQNIYVDVTSAIPTAVTDFATDYSAFSQQIIDLADKYPNAKGADDPHVQQVNQLIDSLITALKDIISQVDTVSTKMKDWGARMQKSHDDLTSGASNIQAAEADLAVEIEKMNTAIKNLHKMIEGENKAIAIAAAAIGIGIFMLVAGIALAIATAGAASGAAIVVAGAGGAAIIGGAVTWGIMQAKINEQYKTIAKDMKNLDGDKRQLISLQGLGQASNLAISSISHATSALADFRASWGVFQGELEGIVTKLKQGEHSLSTLVAGTFTKAAEKEWELAVDFAQSLLDQKVKEEKHKTSIETAA